MTRRPRNKQRPQPMRPSVPNIPNGDGKKPATPLEKALGNVQYKRITLESDLLRMEEAYDRLAEQIQQAKNEVIALRGAENALQQVAKQEPDEAVEGVDIDVEDTVEQPAPAESANQEVQPHPSPQ